MRFFRALSCLWLAVLPPACAKVGDPLPPLATVPATTQDLQLLQIADRVRLSFSLPGSDIETVEVYRARAGIDGPHSEAQLITKIQARDLRRQSQDGKCVYEDRPDVGGQKWHYAVRFLGPKRRRSALSNSVHTETMAPALPPTALHCEVLQDRIILRWQPPDRNLDDSRPAHIAGYLVNSEHFAEHPIFEDRQFQFGESKHYRVQTVTRAADPLILSDFSDTLPVVPKDRFPPAPPENVIALLWEGKVRIVWDANKELDLDGYFVYKGSAPEALEKSSGLVTINSYTDEEIGCGATRFYQVSAVDQRGNESERSRVLSITIEGK